MICQALTTISQMLYIYCSLEYGITLGPRYYRNKEVL